MRQNNNTQKGGSGIRTAIERQRSIDRQQVVFSAAHEQSIMGHDSLMWAGPDDLLNQSRGSIQMNLEVNVAKHSNT